MESSKAVSTALNKLSCQCCLDVSLVFQFSLCFGAEVVLREGQALRGLHLKDCRYVCGLMGLPQKKILTKKILYF